MLSLFLWALAGDLEDTGAQDSDTMVQEHVVVETKAVKQDKIERQVKTLEEAVDEEIVRTDDAILQLRALVQALDAARLAQPTPVPIVDPVYRMPAVSPEIP